MKVLFPTFSFCSRRHHSAEIQNHWSRWDHGLMAVTRILKGLIFKTAAFTLIFKTQHLQHCLFARTCLSECSFRISFASDNCNSPLTLVCSTWPKLLSADGLCPQEASRRFCSYQAVVWPTPRSLLGLQSQCPPLSE